MFNMFKSKAVLVGFKRVSEVSKFLNTKLLESKSIKFAYTSNDAMPSNLVIFEGDDKLDYMHISYGGRKFCPVDLNLALIVQFCKDPSTFKDEDTRRIVQIKLMEYFKDTTMFSDKVEIHPDLLEALMTIELITRDSQYNPDSPHYMIWQISDGALGSITEERL